MCESILTRIHFIVHFRSLRCNFELYTKREKILPGRKFKVRGYKNAVRVKESCHLSLAEFAKSIRGNTNISRVHVRLEIQDSNTRKVIFLCMYIVFFLEFLPLRCT